MTPPDLPCNRFIVLVTDYLEGALDPAAQEQVDHHVSICKGCREVLGQWQRTIELTGTLSEHDVDSIDERVRSELLAAFRASA
jgi:hypothetical protein